VALRYEVQTELIDQRGLTRAWHAANADSHRFAGIGQEQLDEGLRLGLILWLRALDQRDGAGKRDPVAGANGLGGPVRLAL
jgi:hypothetical protein